jgi:hypothetical protein
VLGEFALYPRSFRSPVAQSWRRRRRGTGRHSLPKGTGRSACRHIDSRHLASLPSFLRQSYVS